MQATTLILALNAGSSSIKFSLYQDDETLTLMSQGKLIGLNTDEAHLTFYRPDKPEQTYRRKINDAQGACDFLLHTIAQHVDFNAIGAVGHRLVHGLQHMDPVAITPALLKELHAIECCDPQHLPRQLQLIETLQLRQPSLIQIACFDTCFHRNLPAVAKYLPIPRRYAKLGLRRYGFHGLSYSYVMAELIRLHDPAALSGRIIIAHLGNGASVSAILDGKSVDTTMGFTPNSGLPMGSRSGDIEPGVFNFLSLHEHMGEAEFNHMVNEESGLLGVSEISSDMEELLRVEKDEPKAAQAIALFCYQTKKAIGAYAAALGGVDTLVFTGGIGENSASIRARICQGLMFLGVSLDPEKNASHAAIISAPKHFTLVRVIKTNEELMIARSVAAISLANQAD